MESIINYVYAILENLGVAQSLYRPLSALAMFTSSVIILYLIYAVFTHLVEPLIDRITRRTAIKWDDIVFRHKVLRWFWALFICLLAKSILPASVVEYPTLMEITNMAVEIALILTLMMIMIETLKSAFLLLADRENVDEIAEQMYQAKIHGEEFTYTPSHSLKGLEQMLTIIIIGGALILIVSLLLGKSPLIIFSGIGAAAAVLMLIFQDSILGVVAGIQLTANDMLQPGDWIVVPKYEANGVVKEVTLATVKIQNWDMTIVTIPPYKLISEGFQNWRGMQMTEARRVARSFLIDMTSIRMATDKEMDEWRQAEWWHDMPEAEGKMVNLTAFRCWLEDYISHIPSLASNMIYMTRELAPTAHGLPIEIYFFTKDFQWKNYEHVQANALDYIIANIGNFGLRIAQMPTGADVRSYCK